LHRRDELVTVAAVSASTRRRSGFTGTTRTGIIMLAGALAFASVLAPVAACRRSTPAPSSDETTALASARTVPPDPSAGCASAASLAAVDGEQRTITVGEEERSFLLDAPPSTADRPSPVVLAFHGFRSNGRQQRWWSDFPRLARRDGFIAVHPDGHDGVQLLSTTGRGWDSRPDDTRDLAFVNAILDRLEHERCVDRRRVYATGMSNGGFFANVLGCRLADRLAAVAPVAGAMPLTGCIPAQAIPVLLIYGRADRIVRADLVQNARAWWAERDGCGAPVELDGCVHYDRCRADLVYCEGPQAHTWPSDASERIWRFFQTHPRR
jgi:polyhydroxybutyrate depolymerase